MNSEEVIRQYMTSGRYVSVDKSFDAKSGYVNKKRIESRTQNEDITDALRLRVYDPLWMLSKQWQLGEFRGNDTGCAMSVCCEVASQDCSQDPIEPITERINPTIDFMVRVESAMYFIDLLRTSNVFSPSELKDFVCALKTILPIDWSGNDMMFHRKGVKNDSDIDQYQDSLNTTKTLFNNSFKNSFDGYDLYVYLSNTNIESIETVSLSSGQGILSLVSGIASQKLLNLLFGVIKYKMQPLMTSAKVLLDAYVVWFRKKYLPVSMDGNHWNAKTLSYSAQIQVDGRKMISNSYHGGRMSWHTCDFTEKSKGNARSNETIENIVSIPTLATYPGCPNKRLWQFEDKKVYMGNSSDSQSTANAVFLKFATMYANDWMRIPLQTKIGQYLRVKGIVITDTFGDVITIDKDKRAGANDVLQNNLQEPWQMYTCSVKNDETGDDGLFFAPQLASTLEGGEVEEVQFVRDEMSNMIWGIERKIPNGCGSSIDQKKFVSDMSDYMISRFHDDNEKTTDGEGPKFQQNMDGTTSTEVPSTIFKYSLQTSVPFNWIPFVPQRLKGSTKNSNPFLFGGREIILRRGKFPYWVKEKDGNVCYDIRPVGTILREGINGDVESPLYIDEGEIESTGCKLVKNFQRSRWLNGKVYNWFGISKKLSLETDQNSLNFDVLEEKI